MAVLALTICATLAVVLVNGQGCGRSVQFAQGRIINGQVPPACSVPWHVQIHFFPDRRTNTLNKINLDWEDTYRCAGVIYNELYVYIAPACIYLNYPTHGEALAEMVIVAGDADLSDVSGTEQVRYATDLYFPSFYTIRSQQEQISKFTRSPFDYEVLRNDQCAVVKLNTPLILNDCVSPVCLPAENTPDCVTESCITVGHGFQGGTANRSPIMQFSRMTALPQRTCSFLQSLNLALPGSASTFCARTETNGIPCFFDMGSSLSCWDGTSWYLRGANVNDRCLQTSPSMYAYIKGPCANFMKDVLNNNVAPLASAP